MHDSCVFDTNSLISALLIKDSVSREAFDKAIDDYQLLISKQIIAEFEDVVGRAKFKKYITPAERNIFTELLYDVAKRVEVTAQVQVSRDPDDDKFLALALTSRAEIIVSGDKDLLVLDPFRQIRIVQPRVFVEQF